MRNVIIGLLSFLIIINLAFATSDIPPLPGVPHQFKGSVMNYGNPLLNNTLVIAKIDGSEVAAAKVIDGNYGYKPELFYVQDPNNDRQGKTIEFYVNINNVEIKAAEYIFMNGESTLLDLSISADICGDGYCTGSESCSSCAVDCGTCSNENDNSPGGSPSGSLPSGSYTPPAQCTPNWVCSEWLDCINGIQKRICVDSNRCGIAEGKPIEQKECLTTQEQNTENNTSQKEDTTPTTELPITAFIVGNTNFIYGVTIIIIIIILYVIYRFWISPKKPRKKKNKN